MTLIYTGITAGALGLIHARLLLSVVELRDSEKIAMGHNNNKLLEQRIRG